MTKRSIFRRIVDFFKRSPEVKLEKERRKVEKISNKLKQKQKMVESLEVEDKSKVKEKPRQSEFAEIKELPPGIEPLGEDETIYDYQLEEKSKRKSLKERALDNWKEYKKRHTLYETCYLIVETQEAISNPSNPNYKPTFENYSLDIYRMENNDDLEWLSYFERLSKYPVYTEYRCPIYSDFPVSREEAYRILLEEEQ